MSKYTGKTVYLRHYNTADAAARLSILVSNREFFQQFLYSHDDSYYTLEGQLAYLEEEKAAREQDKRYSFGIFLRETDELIGDISFFEIERGFLEKCMIGYWLDQRFNRRGYMTEAVSLALKTAFGELHFHRVEAGVMSCNLGSVRVLEKTGFTREGLARRNVKINGRWEDHLMFAILEEDIAPPFA